MKHYLLRITITLLSLFGLISIESNAQTDTIWLSSNGKSPVKQDSIFYKFEDGIQIIDGEIHLNRNHYYTNGALRKEIITPNTTLSFNHRTLKTKYYNLKGESRMEIETRLGHVWDKEKVYLDEKGKEIARYRYLKGGVLRGKKIRYYFDDILTIKEITEVSDSLTTKTLFYKSGKIARKIVESKTSKQETAYDRAGNIIGNLEYVYDNGWVVRNGKKIVFNFYNPLILGYQTYKNKRMIESRVYQEAYPDFPGIHYLVKGDTAFTFYEFNGEPLDTFIKYENTYSGTQYVESPDQVNTYKKNTLIGYIQYFKFWNGKIQQTLKNDTITYYNLLGEKLGTLKQTKTGKPLNGTEYTYYHTNKVASKTNYKTGQQVYKEYYDYHPETNKRYMYYRLRKDSLTGYFYSGKPKFTRSKTLEYQYYSPAGDSLPQYDDKFKGKVAYKYFFPPYDHLLKEKTVKKDGEIVYSKVWFKPDKTCPVQDSCQVHYIYKTTGLNYVYNENGTELEKILRRNGQVTLNDHHIFETIIKYPTAESIDISYREGTVVTQIDVKGGSEQYTTTKTDNRNGPFKHYSHYSGRLLREGTYKYHQLEGLCKEYYDTGKLKKTEHYSYGKLHGVATYYDPNGGQAYTMLYKNGNPYSGYKPNNITGMLEVYNTGICMNKIPLEDYNPAKADHLVSSESIELVNPETRTKYASLVMKNETITGAITYYNIKGKRIYKGLYKDGVLEEGDIFFEINDENAKPKEATLWPGNKDKYTLVHLTCKDDMYTITFYNHSMEVKNRVKLRDYTDIIELIKSKTKEESVYNKDTKGYEYNEFKYLNLSQQTLDILVNPENKINR